MKLLIKKKTDNTSGCGETLTETGVTEYLQYGLTDKEIGKRVAENYLNEIRDKN